MVDCAVEDSVPVERELLLFNTGIVPYLYCVLVAPGAGWRVSIPVWINVSSCAALGGERKQSGVAGNEELSAIMTRRYTSTSHTITSPPLSTGGWCGVTALPRSVATAADDSNRLLQLQCISCRRTLQQD